LLAVALVDVSWWWRQVLVVERESGGGGGVGGKASPSRIRASEVVGENGVRLAFER
jgi:hypothetical protein